MVDKDKSITGDSLFYVKDKDSEGFGNVIYVDKRNKNSLHCGYLRYNEKTGYGWQTGRRRRVYIKRQHRKPDRDVHV